MTAPSLLSVVILTTAGPSEVCRIRKLDLPVGSVMCLHGKTASELPVSTAYRKFVDYPTGIIEQMTGHAHYKLEVSDPIEAGESWQLGVFLAHWLDAEGRLAASGDEADTVVFATGEVKPDHAIGAVPHAARKLRLARERIAAEAAAGRRVLAILPDAILDDARKETDTWPASERPELLPARHWDDFRSRLVGTDTAGPGSAPDRRGWIGRRFLAIAALLAVAGSVAVVYSESQPPTVSEPAEVVGDAPAEVTPRLPEAEAEIDGKGADEAIEDAPSAKVGTDAKAHDSSAVAPVRSPTVEAGSDGDKRADETPAGGQDNASSTAALAKPAIVSILPASVRLAVSPMRNCRSVEMFGNGELEPRFEALDSGPALAVDAPLCRLTLQIGPADTERMVAVRITGLDADGVRSVIAEQSHLMTGGERWRLPDLDGLDRLDSLEIDVLFLNGAEARKADLDRLFASAEPVAIRSRLTGVSGWYPR